MDNINLNNYKWQVKGFWPYIPFLSKSIETGSEMMGVTEWFKACVPGGIHADLTREGIIEDPYYELNSLKCEWVENRWWLYKTTFVIGQELKDKRLELILKGVDYKAHFYLNQQKLGEHEGMFEAVCFDITDKVIYDAGNLLEVLFESVPDEMSQIGYTSKTHTQKSRFSYKWDWCTRLVNIGLWDDVLIRVTKDFIIDEVHVNTDVIDATGIVNISAVIRGKAGETCSVKAILSYGGNLLEYLVEYSECSDNDLFEFKKSISVDNPRLWYPNGDGEQSLYKLVLQVFQNETLSDEKQFNVGIRKLEYRQNQGSPEDSLPYTIVINGKPIYIKGINLTPFDQMYGTVSNKTYEKYVKLLRLANINLVRVNGVGIIEKEYFYQICDINGIMIWQDFIQSSSGIENVPSTDVEFMRLQDKTVINVVKTKRNHVSLVIWCGGNELTDINRVPITCEHPNISRIMKLVSVYDPDKLFLPSTSSGPLYDLDINQPGKNHDVHGSWKYEGIKNHYQMYNNSDSLFHSEFGTDGMSCVSSLRKFLGEKNIKITNMKENLVWRHHGEWWDTLSRDEAIFSQFETLENFIKASQFIQAEGLRYIIEANRRRKFLNSGSMIWQFNEAWPNVSGTYLVDYYFMTKMAYYWVKNAYGAVVASLKHEGLVQPVGSVFKGELYLNNSLDRAQFIVRWEFRDLKGNLLAGEDLEVDIDGNCVLKIKSIIFEIPQCTDEVFFIRLKVLNAGKEIYSNLYNFSQKESEIFSTLKNPNRKSLMVKKNENDYLIKNVEDKICLFVHGTEKYGAIPTFIENNYISLFPGEEALFKVLVLDEDKQSQISDMEVVWDYL